MSQPTRTSHPIYNLLPMEVEGFDSLAELALDMHSSWKKHESFGNAEHPAPCGLGENGGRMGS